MAKIYNEVVIDMNPESSTFEETLYEDSYEYDDGDMMLMQGSEVWVEAGKSESEGRYWYYKYRWNEDSQSWLKEEQGTHGTDGKFLFDAPKTLGGTVFAHGTTADDLQSQARKSTSDYGLESLSMKDFVNEDGTQKTDYEILTLIKQHKPNTDKSDEDILKMIRNELPKLGAVSEEDKGFAREGFQKDVYGISKDAGKAGAQMQKAYGGGMGSSMRGAIAGQKDVTQQFKQAEQGLEQDMYGLEQEAAGEFESDIGSWLQGIGDFKQGGRVPSKQTFSDVLSKIRDAGGS